METIGPHEKIPFRRSAAGEEETGGGAVCLISAGGCTQVDGEAGGGPHRLVENVDEVGAVDVDIGRAPVRLWRLVHGN